VRGEELPLSEEVMAEFAGPPETEAAAMRKPPVMESEPAVALPPMAKDKADRLPAPQSPKAMLASTGKSAEPSYWQTSDYQQLLKGAALPLKGGVSLVPTSKTSVVKVYRWESNNHYGTAEQQPLPSQAAFKGMVDSYVDRYKSRCGGQFAADQTDIAPVQGGMTSAYEIACVAGGGKGSGASLLFYAVDGLFTVIALEGAPDKMAQAMDDRDKLVQALATKS
jgi:hypothetical protein